MNPSQTADRRKSEAARDPKKTTPPMVKLERNLKEAILILMAYVRQATGIEPSQEEIAAVFKSHFTLDEVTNQINYLKKRPRQDQAAGGDSSLGTLAFRINLRLGPPKNTLARAGLFSPAIAEGIARMRKHAETMLGAAPSDEDIALSLKSTFILSELKNQIVHARKHPRKLPA
jgi:hypothetical protein